LAQALCRLSASIAAPLRHPTLLVCIRFTDMVVKNRISYLRRMLEMGAKLTITASHNDVTGVDKFKVIVDPSIRINHSGQYFMQQILDMLDKACDTHRIADKGHTHSKETGGKSEVHFLLTSASTARTVERNTVSFNVDASEVIDNSCIDPSPDNAGPLGTGQEHLEGTTSFNDATEDETIASSSGTAASDPFSGVIAMLDAEIAKFCDVAEQGRNSIDQLAEVRKDTLAKAGNLSSSSIGHDIHQLRAIVDEFEVENHFDLLQKKSQLDTFEKRLTQMREYREQLVGLQGRAQGMSQDEVSSRISAIFSGEAPDKEDKSPLKKKPRKIKPRKTGK